MLTFDNLFPSPILITTLDINLIKAINFEVSKVIGLVEWKTPKVLENTQKLSTNNFSENWIKDNNLNVLLTTIDYYVDVYCHNLNYRYGSYAMHSWATLNTKGDYSIAHDHGHAEISGVYYFQTNGEDGDFYINSPVPEIKCSNLFNNFHSPRIIKPQVGRLLLFPGFMTHGVRKNITDNNRISIAFNIYFDKPIQSF